MLDEKEWKSQFEQEPLFPPKETYKKHDEQVHEHQENIRLLHILEQNIERMKKQAKVMQKALEWYADEDNYDMPTDEFYIATKLDRGERARQALKDFDRPKGIETNE